MTPSDTFVYVVDDDESWRTSAQRLLSAAGYQVALYDSAESFLEAADRAGPGCVLLDLRMSGLTGLELQQRLVGMERYLPIVFVSGHADIPTSVLAMKLGAQDFLTKPVDTVVLLATIEAAVKRGSAERDRRAHLDVLRSRVAALTPTERKVFARVVRGDLNKRIASDLGTAERTIKWHRQHIMQKLGVHSLAELVSLAEKLDLVDDASGPSPGTR